MFGLTKLEDAIVSSRMNKSGERSLGDSAGQRERERSGDGECKREMRTSTSSRRCLLWHHLLPPIASFYLPYYPLFYTLLTFKETIVNWLTIANA